MVFIHPQDTPEVVIIVNKPPPKILNEIKLQDTDLLIIARYQADLKIWPEFERV